MCGVWSRNCKIKYNYIDQVSNLLKVKTSINNIFPLKYWHWHSMSEVVHWIQCDINCSYCSGNGAVFSGYYDYFGNPMFVPCQNCYGTGFVLVPTSSNSPSFQYFFKSFKASIYVYRVAI